MNEGINLAHQTDNPHYHLTTVGDLIQVLSRFDPERKVMISVQGKLDGPIAGPITVNYTGKVHQVCAGGASYDGEYTQAVFIG